ncbi:MAG: recombinase family protein, partial [Mycobacteriales bacterium]
MPMTPRAAIYARVSSDPRGSARSVAEQERECRRTAALAGWDVVELFIDNDRSASRYATKSRPAYAGLVEFVRSRSCDVVVTWEASRFQRDLQDYVVLRELCRDRGVLWSYSGRTYDLSRTDDRLTTGLDALLAERESDMTRDRVLRSVRANADAGRPHGKLLYGYRRVYDDNTGALTEQVPREDQAVVVREAARRVATGETPHAVASDLNRRGIPAPRGGCWDLTQIRRLVTNPAYVGKRVHRGKVVGEAVWPALVDEATFYTCVSRMSDPRRKTVRDSAIKHLLSGIAICGVCGARVVVQKNRGSRAYLCPDGFHVSRRQDHVDDLVTKVLVTRLARPDVLELLGGAQSDDRVSAALGEAAEKRARLESFYDSAAEGELTPAALARIEARLIPEIEAAERYAREVTV